MVIVAEKCHWNFCDNFNPIEKVTEQYLANGPTRLLDHENMVKDANKVTNAWVD